MTLRLVANLGFLLLFTGCVAVEGQRSQELWLDGGYVAEDAGSSPGQDGGSSGQDSGSPGQDAGSPGQDAAVLGDAFDLQEPACPEFPPGVEPIDPGIPSGGQCRGACGAACPETCRSVPAVEKCLEWQDSDGTWHYKVCRWDGLIECGSHAGCRAHDDCYDGCESALCRRGCDWQCVRDNGAANCNSWRQGNGPYDSWISYGPGTFTEDGPYDTTCY